jgi:site-specific DNA recombinase
MMTPTALYCRVSTDEQAEKYGLAAQLHELRAHAAKAGYTVADEYLDDGYSGASLDRPALTRLRDAVRAGAVAVVLAHDPDRLSRKLAHQLLLLEELEQRARVEFVTTARSMTPEGSLLLNVKGIISEYERAKIVERTVRGKLEKARRGLVVASYPYGYRPDPASPGRLVINEPEAATIRMIYAWLIDEQRSTRSIVDELRRLGVPSSKPGRQWGPTQVRRILQSARYTGLVHYGQEQVIVGGRRRRPEADWITVPIPAIITPERHAAALAALGRNREALVGRPARFTYLLRGLLRCGTCAARYQSVPAHGRRYYRCYGRDRFTKGPRCRSPWISARITEAEVWKTVRDALRRPEILRHGVERWEARQGARDVEIRSRVEVLARKVRTIETKERRLLDLYLEDGLDKTEIAGRLRTLTRERDGLRAELQRAEAHAAAQGATGARLEAIDRWAAEARQGIDQLDDAGRQKVLQALVDEIIVRPDRSLEIRGILPSTHAAPVLHPPS